MEEQQNRKPNKPDPDDNPPPPVEPPDAQEIVPPIAPAVRDISITKVNAKDPAIHQKKRSKSIKRIEKTLADRVRDAERWMIVLTAIIALATVGNVIVYYLESESTSRQTTRLIDESKRVANAMEKSVSKAQEALEASDKASRMDQRAWVGAKMATGPTPFKTDAPGLTVGQKAVMGVILGNSGKTPALHFKGQTDFRILPKGIAFSPRYRPPADAHLIADTTLAPGGLLATMVKPGDETVTQKMLDELRATSSILYLFGSYTYEDAFGVNHFIKFCMFATSDLNGMAACGTYNQAN